MKKLVVLVAMSLAPSAFADVVSCVASFGPRQQLIVNIDSDNGKTVTFRSLQGQEIQSIADDRRVRGRGAGAFVEEGRIQIDGSAVRYVVSVDFNARVEDLLVGRDRAKVQCEQAQSPRREGLRRAYR